MFIVYYSLSFGRLQKELQEKYCIFELCWIFVDIKGYDYISIEIIKMFYLRIGFLYNKKIEKEFNKIKGDENR